MKEVKNITVAKSRVSSPIAMHSREETCYYFMFTRAKTLGIESPEVSMSLRGNKSSQSIQRTA